MADPYIGEIRMVGFNFAPQGWAFCDGQLLAISQNTALFSLLGTTYGGNGQTTFALPDLRSRVPMHKGQGPGLSSYLLGQNGGVEAVTLTVPQIPLHSHPTPCSSDDPNAGSPVNNVLAAVSTSIYSNTSNASMASTSAGGGQPHTNQQPYLVINFCIALQGIFPSRS
jgi:microcystin-dependent protein